MTSRSTTKIPTAPKRQPVTARELPVGTGRFIFDRKRTGHRWRTSYHSDVRLQCLRDDIAALMEREATAARPSTASGAGNRPFGNSAKPDEAPLSGTPDRTVEFVRKVGCRRDGEPTYIVLTDECSRPTIVLLPFCQQGNDLFRLRTSRTLGF